MKKTVWLAALYLTATVSPAAWADINQGAHLNSRGQSKVNRAIAKGYQQSGAEAMQRDRTQVNIGSKRAGDCVMNVGATPAGQKSPKEVIVTSKEIINVCR